MLTQRDLHEQLRTEALASHQRIAVAARGLDPERLLRRPAPNAWSVGEVLEHLCTADDLHARPVTALVHGAHRDAGAPFREWKPTLLGKLIANGLQNPRRLKAPRSLQIGPTPRNAVVEAFLTHDAAVAGQMDDAATLDWRALRIEPLVLPPLARRILRVKYNLGDVFRIRVVHVRRHLEQIERTIAQLS